MTEHGEKERIRIDKWLWAARFFKTRTLAAQAVTGGHVQVNSQRVKPARLVQPGEELRIRRGEEEFVITVMQIAARRGPAAAAQLLYQESEESFAARARAREQRRLTATAHLQPTRRPTKKERRQIIEFVRKNG